CQRKSVLRLARGLRGEAVGGHGASEAGTDLSFPKESSSQGIAKVSQRHRYRLGSGRAAKHGRVVFRQGENRRRTERTSGPAVRRAAGERQNSHWCSEGTPEGTGGSSQSRDQPTRNQKRLTCGSC